MIPTTNVGVLYIIVKINQFRFRILQVLSGVDSLKSGIQRNFVTA